MTYQDAIGSDWGLMRVPISFKASNPATCTQLSISAAAITSCVEGGWPPIARPTKNSLTADGVGEDQIYSGQASDKKDDCPGLEACLKALREGDVLLIWKLDRMGRNLNHSVNTTTTLSERGVGLKVLTGQGAQIDTTTAAGRVSFGIFAALAEFESDLIREPTMAGLQAAGARGRKGGRKFALTKAQVRMAQAAMASRDTSVTELCKALEVKPVTLYRYVDPNGNLCDYGKRVLGA